MPQWMPLLEGAWGTVMGEPLPHRTTGSRTSFTAAQQPGGLAVNNEAREAAEMIQQVKMGMLHQQEQLLKLKAQVDVLQAATGKVEEFLNSAKQANAKIEMVQEKLEEIMQNGAGVSAAFRQVMDTRKDSMEAEMNLREAKQKVDNFMEGAVAEFAMRAATVGLLCALSPLTMGCDEHRAPLPRNLSDFM